MTENEKKFGEIKPLDLIVCSGIDFIEDTLELETLKNEKNINVRGHTSEKKNANVRGHTSEKAFEHLGIVVNSDIFPYISHLIPKRLYVWQIIVSDDKCYGQIRDLEEMLDAYLTTPSTNISWMRLNVFNNLSKLLEKNPNESLFYYYLRKNKLLHILEHYLISPGLGLDLSYWNLTKSHFKTKPQMQEVLVEGHTVLTFCPDLENYNPKKEEKIERRFCDDKILEVYTQLNTHFTPNKNIDHILSLFEAKQSLTLPTVREIESHYFNYQNSTVLYLSKDRSPCHITIVNSN